MYSSKQEAYGDYLNRAIHKVDNDLDYHATSQVYYNTEPRTIRYWETPDVMNKAIAKITQRLQEMIQDGKSAEDPSLSAEESWKDNSNDIQDDYPTWNEYRYSDSYYRECEVLSDIFWKDFNDEYEEELKEFKYWKNWNDLKDQIEDLIDEIKAIPEKINEIVNMTKREVIVLCFEDEDE